MADESCLKTDKPLLLPYRLWYPGTLHTVIISNDVAIPPTDDGALGTFLLAVSGFSVWSDPCIRISKGCACAPCELLAGTERIGEVLVPVRRHNGGNLADLFAAYWTRKIRKKLRRYERGKWDGGRIRLKASYGP